VIVFVRTGFWEHWTADVGHAVVVVGITDDQVYIHDPAIAKAPLAISMAGFEAAWTEMDYGYALVTPAASKG
jgi:ABC-type bacteriocin/lantibiotic exporter with double-glycine peptidase domain